MTPRNFLVIWCIWAVICLGLLGGAIWVALHFLLKLW